MITSVYLSNNMIQIVQGEKSTKLPVISRVIQEEIAEGSLLNGVITNEQELSGQLKEIWGLNNLPTKDVELVLNSSKIVSKNVVMPDVNRKTLVKNLPMEFADVEQKEAVIYDYSFWNKGKEKSSGEILALMVEVSHIQSYINLFTKLGVHLNRITFAKTAMRSFLTHVKGLEKDANIILLVDGNSLISILWVEGRMVSQEKKRLFVEPGSDGFTTEVLKGISNIKQLHSSQKIEVPIKHIYTTGFFKSDIEACNGQLGELDLNYEMLPLPCKQAEAIFAGSGLLREKKDLNFLEVLKNKKKSVETEKKGSLRQFAPVAAVLGLCLIASAGLFGFTMMREATLAEVKEYNANSKEAAQAVEYNIINAKVQELRTVVKGVGQLQDTLKTYPLATSVVKNEILALATDDIHIEFASYDSGSGALDMNVTVDDPEDIPKFIDSVDGTGLFFDIQYSGFTFDENQGNYNLDVSCFLAESAGR